ncbi:heavy metal-associated isoprenylated plant protein 3-like isoform X2 [Punica granatum]|uniref:Heavy metal-associated isoprenylated plant protein 3-like isoform X2 n=1 Tax=Punica granatum TaxID=22663 RepID=A0A6P8CLN6_PUNGR|nr:heavy metal-associated isoprenylated plant protein 3-like isoform X2 [Punica granatum]
MGEKDNGGEKKKSCCCGEDGKKDEKKNGPNAVVLKIDMHCEGCASKIIKCAKAFEGVEKAKVEWEASKLTVEGKVDPTKLRERLQEKTKKKVELVSPLPKKDKENKDDNTATTTSNKNNKNSGSGDSKGQEKKKADEKKPKEPPATTAVLKLGLHCQGCVQKIHKFVSKTSGVTNVTIEQQKDLVTVTGTMDVKALAETLKGRMKRVVEIVPPKKEKEKVKDNEEKKDGNKGSGGGNEKEGCGNGNNQGNGSGGGKKKKGAGGGGGGEYGNAVGNKEEENGSAVGLGYPANTGYGYGCGYGYGYTYGESVHAPQYFSDENPNACSVM